MKNEIFAPGVGSPMKDGDHKDPLSSLYAKQNAEKIKGEIVDYLEQKEQQEAAEKIEEAGMDDIAEDRDIDVDELDGPTEDDMIDDIFKEEE